MSSTRVNIYIPDEELLSDLELLSANEPSLKGIRNRQRLMSPYLEIVLRKHRDENMKKVKQLRKAKSQQHV